MNLWIISINSLRHYRRTQIGVWLGLMIGAMVLTGSLIVGDSVRYSLDRMALKRLGETHIAVTGNDRFFRAELADELAEEIGTGAARVILIPATLSAPGKDGRIHEAQVIGVDESFWNLHGTPAAITNNAPAIYVNERVANRLNLKPGERILARFERLSALSRDAPLSEDKDLSLTFGGELSAVLPDDSIGRFGLQANQIAPYNIFVPLADLQKKLEREGRVNLALLGKGATDETVTEAMRKVWKLADAELEIQEVPDQPVIELRTPRVFLEPRVERVALGVTPNARPTLTYFVNEFRVGDTNTPYSMITGLPASQWDGQPGEIDINAWLAQDLGAQIGDAVTIKYYIMGPMRQPVEKETSFKLRKIVPLEGWAADRTLMPDFPGLKDADSCRDWETGFPIELERMDDKDQEYWDQHRGTPKAFIALADATSLWSNRFGNVTSVRFSTDDFDPASLEAALKEQLTPKEVGLIAIPVRQMAFMATAKALPFDQLFLSLSFFLIAAALLLSGMLFVFGVEQRVREIGTLLAIGYTPKRVRGMLLREAALLSLTASVVGAALATQYTKGILHGLGTIWKDAVGTTSIFYYVDPLSLIVGVLASTLLALLVIFLILRKQTRRPVQEILASTPGSVPPGGSPRVTLYGAIAIVSFLGAVAMLLPDLQSGNLQSATFFGSGSLILIGTLCFIRALLGHWGRASANKHFSSFVLTLRNSVRRRGRSLATIALLASGSFIVLSIEAHRLDAMQDADLPASGTGGFDLHIELTQPLLRDLNLPKEQEAYGLDTNAFAQATFALFRVKGGDEASCLNLNRAQQPRVLGANPDLLTGRFLFAATHQSVEAGDDPWQILRAPTDDGTVPGIADQNVILWALGLKLGDIIEYEDEKGQTLKVKLVGSLASSILQGSILIDEERFTDHFPSAAGYRMVLADQAIDRAEDLNDAFDYYGIKTKPAFERLAEFNAIQNTYLSIFQVLGGLGLLLGSFGLGIVVLRNILERRAELGLLRAVGFSRRRLRHQIVTEHSLLILTGLLCGLVAAAIAVLPSVLNPATDVSFPRLTITAGIILLNGIIWTVAAASVALRGEMIGALRSE